MSVLMSRDVQGRTGPPGNRGRFSGGPLLHEVYRAPRWTMTSETGTKIVVTRCVSHGSKYVKNAFAAPEPAGGDYSAPQTPSWI